MNQIIKPESINFSELIKNSKTTLSLSENYKSEMIEILNTEFTEEQQKWFIANLFAYLHFHPTNDYPVNLEHVYKDLGFANKGNAMKTMKSNFSVDEDYKLIIIPREKKQNAGRSEHEIMLNIDTFKNLCMLVKTDKGKEIRKYYVKLENIYNSMIKKEIENKDKLLEDSKKLIEEKENIIEQLENKPDTYGFESESGYIYMAEDETKHGHNKIGFMKHISRMSELNTASSTNSIKLVCRFFTFDKVKSESIIHRILEPFRIKMVKKNEWFFFKNKTELAFALKIMKECTDFVNTYHYKSYDDFNTKNMNLNYDELLNEYKLLENDYKKYEKNQSTELINEYILNNDTTYTGVCWDIQKNKWGAKLQFNNVSQFLGYYDNQIDAAKAYNNYALYLNENNNGKFILNNIIGYQTVAINVPEENKKTIMENKTSKYIGVYLDKKNKFTSIIVLSRKKYYLGQCETEIEAAKLYNQQALYFNNTFKSNYILNDIPNYITEPKNISKEIKDNLANNKSSKYNGVSFTKNMNKWNSYYMINRKRINIGYFENEIDAAKAYNNTVLELNKNGSKYKINILE